MSSSEGARNARWTARYAVARTLHRTELDAFIQAAHPISLWVDDDFLIADAGERAHDSRVRRRRHRAHHFVAADLDAREAVVMPHAAHTESDRAQRLLGAFDHAQLLDGDG